MDRRYEIGDRVRIIDTGMCYTIEEIEVRDDKYYIWSSELPNAYYTSRGFRGQRGELMKNWHNPIPQFTELVEINPPHRIKEHKMV